jgi:hypothetical protein
MRDGRIVDALEESEPTGARAVMAVVGVVEMGGDAADVAAAAPRDESLDLEVGERGVADRIEELQALAAERLDVVRVVAVDRPGDVEKTPPVAAAPQVEPVDRDARRPRLGP